MRAVVLSGAGDNDVVQIRQRVDPALGARDLMIDVQVAGMNPADVHQRDGHYPAPSGVVSDIPGLEVAGVVIASGSEATRWRQGDRVFGLVAGGGLADRVAVDERCVTSVPANLSVQEAAAVPEAFITAHDALRQASLRPAESLFVRGATGAVGSAAVQIGRSFGARILDAPSEIGPEGVDVVIDLIGGDDIVEDLGKIAVGGRIIVVGIAGGSHTDLDLRRLMNRRATIRGTVLRARSTAEKGEAVQAFADDVVPLLRSGAIAPSIDSVWALDDVQGAFDRLQQRGKRGKVMLRLADDPTN